MQDQTARLTRIFDGAVRYHREGLLAEAEQLYRQVLSIDERHAGSLYQLGEIALARGQYAAAENLCARQIASSGVSAATHTFRGRVQEAQGRFEQAIAEYDTALHLDPGHADAHRFLGRLLGRMEQLERAAEHFAHAVRLNPDDAGSRYNLGLACERQGLLDRALEHYDALLARTPGSAEAHNSRGTVLYALNRADEALASFDAALAIKPAYIEALNNRGSLLLHAHRLVEALGMYDRAMAVHPNPTSLHNQATALMRLGRLDDALRCIARAQSLAPDAADVHWAEAMCRLLGGDFARGWEKYEWRRRLASYPPREFSTPLWSGRDDLAGKSILIHAEQGLGDTLQFCRLVPFVAAKGARVIFEVQPQLLRLMKDLGAAATLIARGDPIPPTDCQCPLLSLPFALKIVPEAIPAAVPYLSVPEGLAAKWQDILGSRVRPRVGLVWSRRFLHFSEHHRAIPPASLEPLLHCGVDLISLQKEYRDEDKEWLAAHSEVKDFSSELTDFAETAALASEMDLIVSIDTSTVHMAGALGLPVWIPLSYVGDWRWMLAREDSPWYPTARLYRQTYVNDWDGVIARIAADLKARF